MGLFDFLKKNKVTSEKSDEPQVHASSASDTKQYVAPQATNANSRLYAPSDDIPPIDRPFYNPDEYYTYSSNGKDVVTFEERMKTAYPSARGLYPADILLLEYVSYGKYPRPKNGYPGLWWFEFGIRNVGKHLDYLENNGFIRYTTPFEMLDSLKVGELKDILTSNGLPTTGKKADYLTRIRENLSEESLRTAVTCDKYCLTDLGISELEDNGYVAYMYKHPRKTSSLSEIGIGFNVWSINRLVHKSPESSWQDIVSEQEDYIGYLSTERISIERVLNMPVDDNLSRRISEFEEKIKADKDFFYYSHLCGLYIEAKLYNKSWALLNKMSMKFLELEEQKEICDLRADALIAERGHYADAMCDIAESVYWDSKLSGNTTISERTDETLKKLAYELNMPESMLGEFMSILEHALTAKKYSIQNLMDDHKEFFKKFFELHGEETETDESGDSVTAETPTFDTKKRSAIRKYLKEQKENITLLSNRPGSGYEEEDYALRLYSIGKIEEGLVFAFASKRKKFDAPALYTKTAEVLHRNGMYREEIDFLESGIKYMQIGQSRAKDDMKKNLLIAKALLQKEKEG